MPRTQSSVDVAAEIRAEMARQRVTMLKLAGLTGFARTTLMQQINGDSKMSVDVLMAAAAALGVDPADFLPSAAAVATA